MQELTFVGVSQDGSRLLLALTDGRRYALVIDERLRAATRGTGRPKQMAIPTEVLRPREVQARLRAGATQEEVAEQSGWTMERVESFAVPIMQERLFVAQQARRAFIRHRDGEMELELVVAQRLAERGINADDLRWDAWRGEDGRWTVLLSYPAGRGDQVATWLFDTESRTLHPVDEEASWLTEHQRETPPAAAAVNAEPDEPGAQIVNLPRERASEPEPSRHPAGRRQSQAPTLTAAPVAAAPAEQEPMEPARTGKRATVPSWDEILFGGTDSENR